MSVLSREHIDDFGYEGKSICTTLEEDGWVSTDKLESEIHKVNIPQDMLDIMNWTMVEYPIFEDSKGRIYQCRMRRLPMRNEHVFNKGVVNILLHEDDTIAFLKSMNIKYVVCINEMLQVVHGLIAPYSIFYITGG